MQKLIQIFITGICIFQILNISSKAEEIVITVNQNNSNNIRSQGLQSYISNMGAHVREFNNNADSLWFGHTFLDLIHEKMVIINAGIKIKIKAISENFSYNDMIFLSFITNNGQMIRSWENTIGSHGPIVGILPFRWESGQSQLIELNLESLPCLEEKDKDILSYLNYYGFLDVLIEDDTLVEEIILTLNYEPIKLTLKIDDPILMENEIVRFPVSLKNPDNIEIESIDGQFNYDYSIIQSFEKAFVLNENLKNDYDLMYNPLKNIFTIYAINNNHFQGEGSIGYIEYKINGNEGQQTIFDFIKSKINNTVVNSEGNELIIPPSVPEISPIESLSIPEDSSSVSINFSVNDIKTPVSELILSKNSNNTALIPLENIIFAGSDKLKTAYIQPNPDRFGTATILFTVIDSDGLTASSQFDLIISPVNDKPAFNVNKVITNEDSNNNTINNYIYDINPGSEESDQLIIKKWIKNISNSSIFNILPGLNGNNLIFSTANDAYGTSTFEVCIQDNGGTFNNGNDTLCKTGTITINSVNDDPNFLLKNIQPVLEDSGLNTVSDFLYNISPGPLNEDSQHIIEIDISVSNESLFSEKPKLSGQTLFFNAAPDSFGESELTICLTDDGGVENGGKNKTCKSHTIIINSVNDAPVFETITNEIILEPGTTSYNNFFCVNFNPGPANESGQNTLKYIITEPVNPELFKKIPEISNDGKLIFELNGNIVGGDKFTVKVQDNGGTENNGQDTSISKIFKIEAKGYNVSGSVIYYRNNIAVPDVTVVLTGTNNSYVMHTDNEGKYEFNNLPIDNYVLQFSKNSDTGGVQAPDVTQMAMYIVGLEEPDCYSRISADIFRNDDFSGLNASKIARYAVELIPCLTLDCNNWAFVHNNAVCDSIYDIDYPYAISFELNGNREDTIKAIRIGDLTGNWKPDYNISVRNLSSATIEIYQDEIISFPIYLSDIKKILGIDIQVKNDSNSIKFNSFKKADALSDYLHIINNNNIDSTKIAIYTTNNNYYSGNKEIAYLSFEVIGEPETKSNITLSMFELNESNASGGFFINNQIVQNITIKILQRPQHLWHFISLSVIPDNPALTAIFPEAKKAYRYIDGAYVSVDKLIPGAAYLVLLPENSENLATGISYSEYKINLTNGYYPVGCVDSDKAKISVIPSDAFGKIFGCDQLKCNIEKDSIKRNEGAWLEILKDCTLHLSK